MQNSSGQNSFDMLVKRGKKSDYEVNGIRIFINWPKVTQQVLQCRQTAEIVERSFITSMTEWLT